MEGVILILLILLTINYFFWRFIFKIYNRYQFLKKEKQKQGGFDDYSVFNQKYFGRN